MRWETCLNIRPELRKDVDEEFAGFFEGFAATPDPDLEGDRFAEEVIERNAENLRGRPVLLMHGRNSSVGHTPVGKVVESAYVPGKGLWVRAGIYKAFTHIWRLVKTGFLNALSIGGFIKRFREQGGYRLIEDAEVTEVSLTPRGANPKARITMMMGKSAAVETAVSYVTGHEAVSKTFEKPLNTPYFTRYWGRLRSQRDKRLGGWV